MGDFPLIDVSMNYVSWFIVLYFIDSYIRIYKIGNSRDVKVWGIFIAFNRDSNSLCNFDNSTGVVTGRTLEPRFFVFI